MPSFRKYGPEGIKDVKRNPSGSGELTDLEKRICTVEKRFVSYYHPVSADLSGMHCQGFKINYYDFIVNGSYLFLRQLHYGDGYLYLRLFV